MVDAVSLREVGLRDGLQSIAAVMSTQTKLAWIEAEARAGVREMEVAAFVRPDRVPQMADAADVVAGARSFEGLTVSALAPNATGAARAVNAGAHVVNFVMSASIEHNRKNVGMTIEQSLAAFEAVCRIGDVRVCGGISTAFGCTLQGAITPKSVAVIAGRMAQSGADEIIVADTVGYADPASIRTVVLEVNAAVSPLPIALHLHDTRGLGLANITAGLECGVRAFDASLGGLGGCPFAPLATGNVVMEDVAFLCEALGLHTGIDLDALVEVRRSVEAALPDVTFHGAFARAGRRRGLTP